MKFNIIDMDTYARKEHYYHYAHKDHCTYSSTATVDISNLVKQIKDNKLRFYPVFIYIVTNIVNRINEFKMGVNKNNELGYYDEVSPSYIIFHDDDKTFSCAYTQFQTDFKKFYNDITTDMEKYKDVKGFRVIDAPVNSFPLSCTPWLNYTAMNINVPYCDNFYAPIITWGKYKDTNGELLLPVTIQVNHAVCDGYHVGQFFIQLQKFVDEFII